MLLKQINNNHTLKLKLAKAILAVLALALFCLSCGKRKPPVPPNERVSQRVDSQAFQRGKQIILSWTMPVRNAASGNVLKIVRADIYRMAEPLTSPLTLTEEEFATKSIVIGTLPITDDDFLKKNLKYYDNLDLTGNPVRLRYAIRMVNESGQKAAFSNFIFVEPAGKVANAPTSLSAEITADAIKLNWNKSVSNIDGTVPVNIVGYNVYRTASEKEPAKLLNKTPVQQPVFNDEFFTFDTNQTYFVRSVSINQNGEPIESDESNIVKVFPKDIFAPIAPASITLAAAQNSISIFFATNVEKDIAGYNIYRSTDNKIPKVQWQLLTPKLLVENTFTDSAVIANQTYYYYITATDKAGNVSDASEIVSETIR